MSGDVARAEKARIISELTNAQLVRPSKRIARLEQLLVCAVDILSTVNTPEARDFCDLARVAMAEKNGAST